MKNFTDKENLNLYGQIVADFINAPESDDAYLEIIQGIQKAFGFSSSFTEKATKYFPSLQRIASDLGENLSKKEMEFLKLWPKYYGIKHIINHQLARLMLVFEGYDHEKDKLVVFSELDSEAKDIYINIDFDEKNLKGFLKQFEKYAPEEYEPRYKSDETFSLYKNWQLDNHELLEVVTIYKELCLKIEEMSNAVSEDTHSKFEKIYESKSIDKHGEIIWLQKAIQIIFTRIAEERSLNKFILFNEYLAIYNERYYKHLVFHPDGTFSYQTPFSTEEGYIEKFNIIEENEKRHASGKLKGKKEWEVYWKSGAQDKLKAACLERYYYDIVFIFIEFMRLSNQRKLANVCEMCKKYFISQKDDSRIKYCPSCSPKSKISRERKNELQRLWRQKKKQEKIKKEREAKIPLERAE